VFIAVTPSVFDYLPVHKYRIKSKVIRVRNRLEPVDG
jgi:hypothetical protein